MPDLLDRIRAEIDERLEASRAAAEEMRRLEAALRALEGVTSATVQGGGATGAQRTPSGRRRTPRGANRQAVLTAVTQRPGASAGEIATASGVAQNVVYVQLRRLAADGLLVKRELPSGRSGYAAAPPTERSPPEPAPPDAEAQAPAATEGSDEPGAAHEPGAGDEPTADDPVDAATTGPPGTDTGEN